MPVVLTQEVLEARFAQYDSEFFGGVMSSGTTVDLPPEMTEEHEDGCTKKDGSVIHMNWRSTENWECTLLHEMCHAFEFRFPDRVFATPEGRAAAQDPALNSHFYDAHSAEFFTLLFCVMRKREHDPKSPDDFSRYYG